MSQLFNSIISLTVSHYQRKALKLSAKYITSITIHPSSFGDSNRKLPPFRTKCLTRQKGKYLIATLSYVLIEKSLLFPEFPYIANKNSKQALDISHYIPFHCHDRRMINRDQEYSPFRILINKKREEECIRCCNFNPASYLLISV